MKVAPRIELQQKRLDELGFVGRGKSKHRPRNDPSLYGGEYPFIQTGEIKATNLYISRYSQTYNEKGLAQSKLWEPGTLCITIAANVAETAILKIRACFPDSIVGFIADPEKSDTHFVKYYLDTLKLQMQSISRGTTQDNLPVEKLLSFKLSVPSVSVQQEISSILSAYDDLIENNTRRIQILEEMAQRIYREWFVDFRFPGYEKVKFVDSEMGKIPEGWKILEVCDICERIGSGGTPSRNKKEYWNLSEINWFKTKELGDSFLFESAEKISKIGLDNSSAKLFPPGTIVMALYAAPTVGRLGILTKESSFNQAACGFVADKNVCSSFYLFSVLFTLRDYYCSISQGAAQQNINVEKAKTAKFVMPHKTLCDSYANYITPVFDNIRILKQKNIVLKKCRDILLPKLISGEIDVSGMYIVLQEQ